MFCLFVNFYKPYLNPLWLDQSFHSNGIELSPNQPYKSYFFLQLVITLMAVLLEIDIQNVLHAVPAIHGLI